MSIGSVGPVLVGDPRQVADEMERWIEESGIDGFNLVPAYSPENYVDFVDLVVPGLQRRGLFRTEYEGITRREHYFGKGQCRLTADHIGSSYRRR